MTLHFSKILAVTFLPDKQIVNFSVSEIDFASVSADFGVGGLVLTSKSGSSRYFASDGQISKSVRRLEFIF